MTNPLRRLTQDKLDEMAPRVSWGEFRKQLEWTQGEHVGMIGPTGSGKTTLAEAILDLRKYVVVLATKPRDESLEEYAKSRKFKRVREWVSMSPDLAPRRILWPDAKSLYSAVVQRKEFQKALASIYGEGAWCVYIDELWFIIHHLKLEREVRTYLQQARSNMISLVVATQRPAFVPVEVYDQSTHLFFWRDNDERNLNRISGISWLAAGYVRALVATLERHEVLYVHTPTGRMLRTRVEL